MNVDFDVVVRENLLRPWLVRKVKRHDSLDEEAYGDRNGTFLEAHLLNLIKSYWQKLFFLQKYKSIIICSSYKSTAPWIHLWR